MGIRNHVETMVNRPLDEVFPFVTDFARLPEIDLIEWPTIKTAAQTHARFKQLLESGVKI
jgi:hypothetical protein